MQQLDLLSWVPPRKVIVFPLVHRVGRIRDVAEKFSRKQTQEHADYYMKQVTDGLISQLSKIGLTEAEINEQIGAFWSTVDRELIRRQYQHTGNKPKGAA